MSGDASWFSNLFSSLWGWTFVILLLEGSIFVHELGHFLAARWRGMKVDCFSLGFGPKIFGWTGKDGVEYKLSLLPLGGYVRLPQLLDLAALEGEPSPESRDLPPVSYRDKMIAVSAGVVFNLLFALALALVLWPLGVPVPASSQTQVVGYVYHTLGELRNGAQKRELALLGPDAPKLDDTPAPAEGKVLPGDRILAVDGAPVKNFNDLTEAIAFSTGRDAAGHPQVTVTLERAGARHDVVLNPALIDTNERSGDAIRDLGLEPAESMVVDDIADGSPAARVGLRPGDKILFADGQAIYSTMQLNEIMDAAPGRPLDLKIQRGGQILDLALQPASTPRTTPLATITLPPAAADAPAPALDILPLYALDEQGDRASPATPAATLLVWNLRNPGGVFGNLRVGDYLLKVNDQPVSSVRQVVDALRATPTGQAPALTYVSQDTHANATLTLPAGYAAAVTPSLTTSRIGAMFKLQTITLYTPPTVQFARVFKQIFETLRSLVNPHSDIGIGQLTGPIGMSRIIYQLSIEDVRQALWFALVININLAFLNLLPIPVLDGGHILFYTISRLRRRDLPLNLIATVQGVFFVLIMGLAAFVIYNDSRRWAGDNAHDSQLLRDSYYLLQDDGMKFPAPPPVTSPKQ